MYDVLIGDKPKSVNRTYPCPICNHEDWCCMTRPDNPPMPDGSDGLLFICMRSPSAAYGDLVIGNDGEEYVTVGKTNKSGAAVYEEKRQYMLRHPNSQITKELSGNTVAQKAAIEKKAPLVIEPEIQPLDVELRDKAYRAMLSCLKLEDRHRDKLHRDGMTDDMIAKNYIVSLPEPDEYRYKCKEYKTNLPLRKDVADKVRKFMGGSIAGIPGFYLNSADKATIAGPGGILYPQFNLYGKIEGIRIGVDRRWKDNNGKDITKAEYEKANALAKANGERCPYTQLGKYMNLSSYKEDKYKLQKRIIANAYKGGSRSGNHLGFYSPRRVEGKYVDPSIVFITEGEKKSIIASYYLNRIVIDVPGVSSYSLLFQEPGEGMKSPIERLKDAGTKVIVVAYDADKAVNAAVADAEGNLIEQLSEYGIAVATAEWDAQTGKGLDDFLCAGGTLHYELHNRAKSENQ